MSYNLFILRRIELAFQSYLQTKVTINVTAGIERQGSITEDGAELPVPLIDAVCARATADALDSGNWEAAVEINVKAPADEYSADDFDELVDGVFAHLLKDTLSDELTAQGLKLTVFRVNTTDMSWTIDGRLWVATLQLTAFCCGTNIQE